MLYIISKLRSLEVSTAAGYCFSKFTGNILWGLFHDIAPN